MASVVMAARKVSAPVIASDPVMLYSGVTAVITSDTVMPSRGLAVVSVWRRGFWVDIVSEHCRSIIGLLTSCLVCTRTLGA
jgi:hypothetical protein